jgi:YD repeat-containing protein
VNGLLRRCTAILVAGVLMLPQLCAPSRAMTLGRGFPTTVRGPVLAAPAGHAPPQRISVPDPPRRTMPLPFLHRGAAPGAPSMVRPSSATRLVGPPMLHPNQIDGPLASSRAHARQVRMYHLDAGEPSSAPRVLAPGRVRGVAAPKSSGVRRTRSVQPASGTGINPWWRYQEESIPGGGRVMVNVGTGNVLLQDDDMSVPHKGIALALRRTYNSQSLHTITGGSAEDGGMGWAPPGMYGNGWTNTFDAHTVSISATQESVYDVDGARYDYTLPSDAASWVAGMPTINATPGDHSSLVFDGACGWLWTKKSGTTYYFYTNNPGRYCPALGTLGAYSGRLRQIIGRNRNTYLTFSYSWDNGDASAATGKVRVISVQTESGITANLAFDDIAGHRLLQTITFPDNVTSVVYGYDASGNLISVSHPPNNAAGSPRQQTYGYQAVGTGSALYWIYSPRLNASIPFGSDGHFLAFLFTGANQATASLNQIAHWAFVNPIIPDGSSSTVLQPGYATGGTYYQYEFYTTGVSTPTLRDSDGHATNWVVDSQARPTQTQACTATSGGTCTGTWLVSNEAWDSDNNLSNEVDPRGNETDYLHDPMGNTTAVGEPYTTTSQGSFKPTKLYDYDAFNNVVAYCDESETHAMQGDWTTATTSISANDSLCASHATAVPHWSATYAYPSHEPNGELTSMTTPMGYTRTFSYAPAQQAGNDFGLPTSVMGAPFVQLDGSTITPVQTFWYDTTGNLRCYSKGQGTAVLSYDVLGRITSVADPDDSSANATSLCGKTSGQPGWNTQTTYTYFPGGSRRSSQVPSERSFGVSTTYTYDADGNVMTEDRHHGCVANKPCFAGTTRKWYDGADRLVEVAQPHDSQPSASEGDPWITRYVYDLSQGNAVSVVGAAGFRAYGNLFSTRNYVRDASGTLAWRVVRGSAFNALDREVQQFSYTVPGHQLSAGSQEYDRTPATLGLRWRKTNPSGEQATYTYDELGRVTNVAYAGDNGTTPAEAFTFDPSGRQVSVTSALFGTEQRTYDADGRLLTVAEPTGGGLTDPATLRYSYYGNGTKSALSVSSGTFTQPNAITYSYRSDGMLQTQSVNAFQSGTWSKTYTAAGRLQSIAGVDRQSRAYDSTGQLATYTLADATIAYPARDPEGNVETVVYPNVPSGSYVAPSFLTETLTNVVNLRGELVDQSFSPNPNFTYPGRRSTTSSGYRDTRAYSQDTSLPPSSSDSGTDIDFLNGIAYGSSSNGDSGAPSYQNKRTTFAFDAGGRQVRSSDIADSFTTFTDDRTGLSRQSRSQVDAETAKTYDAENHTRSYHQSSTTTVNGTPQSPIDHGVSTIGWGPNGHPVQVLNDRGTGVPSTLHWDGDALLFVSDAAGNVVDFKVGTDGETAPSNTGGVTVYDRDNAGVVVMTSNATGNSGLEPLDSSDLSGPSYPSATSVYQPPTRIFFDTNRADGYNFGTFRINGVRAFDAALGSWTTPDAYSGDVHDPASQQRYMWNRNNPYEYSDPTGYDALQIITPNSAFGLGHERIVVYDPRTGKGIEWSQAPAHDNYPRDREKITKTTVSDIRAYARQAEAAGRIVHHVTQSALVDAKENAYAQKRFDTQSTMNYNAVSNSCAEFVGEIMMAGGSPLGQSALPNLNGIFWPETWNGNSWGAGSTIPLANARG